jgi:hypothetical protein
MSVAYDDFSVWIEPSPQGSGYRVRARCRAGEDAAPFLLPADLNDGVLPGLTTGARDVGGPGAPQSGRDGPTLAREIGCRLFRALLSGAVGQLYTSCLGAVPDPRHGLRLRLHLDASVTPELVMLPWELLYWPERSEHLGLQRLSPVVRYFDLPRSVDAPPFAPPLRVLLVPARGAAGAGLDLEREICLIQEALRENGTEVEALERATLERLRERMLRRTFHAAHFMGHGTFDRSSGAGFLQLESEDGQAERVPGEVLAAHLNGCLPRLTVINACNSGRSAADTRLGAFAGVASSLVRSGLTAVVAMSSPITDRAAIAFSKALYKEIAAGEPVDAAVAEGRLAIYRADRSSLEWATPMLFMRTPDGQLFSTLEAEAEISETVPPPGDSISLGEKGQIEGEDVDIINQKGACFGPRPSASIKLDGRIKAKRLTLGNLVVEGHPSTGSKL